MIKQYSVVLLENSEVETFRERNEMKKQFTIREITQIALCVSLLCVASYLVIPLPFTPVVISLQTVMVNVIALILKPKEAGITILIYLLMGFIGLPVFSAGTAGPGKLFGPTGGFYFGFLFAVILISMLRKRRRTWKYYCMVTIIIGIPVQHVCAILVMCMYNGGNVSAAIAAVSLPFFVGDVFKCIIASKIAISLQERLQFFN